MYVVHELWAKWKSSPVPVVPGWSGAAPPNFLDTNRVPGSVPDAGNDPDESPGLGDYWPT